MILWEYFNFISQLEVENKLKLKLEDVVMKCDLINFIDNVHTFLFLQNISKLEVYYKSLQLWRSAVINVRDLLEEFFKICLIINHLTYLINQRIDITFAIFLSWHKKLKYLSLCTYHMNKSSLFTFFLLQLYFFFSFRIFYDGY